MKTKFIFITGGVVSGLGKGITAASLGRLLKNRGYSVVNQKFDPYLNIDPGTMNPIEHGEVFVTDDGAETDLDLGHYERFTDVSLSRRSSITSGQIYQSVINKERNGDYLGKTVQVIPHVTDEIKSNIYSFKNKVDVVITELGGTVGDIESTAFIEAIRQVGLENKPEDVLFIHVTLLPYIFGSNEVKTKPTQHSVKELQSYGIKPDIIVCRTEQELEKCKRDKLALYCNVRPENVIANYTANNLYEVPLLLEKEGLAVAACKHLKLKNVKPQNKAWEKLINNIAKIKKEVNIAIVGKYVALEDSYISVVESLKHGGFYNNAKVNITFVDSEQLKSNNVAKTLSPYDGILVPGGFGVRGIEGKILAIKYAREKNIPFLGICLGLQMATIEFARDVLKIKDANSTEFDTKTKNPVIHIMETQKNITKKGGTMRLGSYPCKIKKGTLAYAIYGKENIAERHRHRFEFNNDYLERLEEKGFIASGLSPDGTLVEMVEYKNHPFFIASQFHPEFKSRPDNPAPLFRAFIKAATLKVDQEQKNNKNKKKK
jgi:CTP synthase